MSAHVASSSSPAYQDDPQQHFEWTGDDALRNQRRKLVAMVLLVHAVGCLALLQVDVVRNAVLNVSPTFVTVVSDVAVQPPEPTPALTPPPPQQLPAIPPPPVPLVAVAPPEPVQAITVPDSQPALTQQAPTPPAAPAPAQPPAPAPVAAQPPAPRMLPPTAVQFQVLPAPVYPVVSRRKRETGRVEVSVYFDETGLPREVKVIASSGFPLLDAAAVDAARKSRLRPPIENGKPTSGLVIFPLDFNLE